MRWPLRLQLLVPLCVLMLATLLAVSVLNAWLSTRRTRRQIERQLQDMAATLAESNIPLGDLVLRHTSGLTGARFMLCDSEEAIIARSDESLDEIPVQFDIQDRRQLTLDRTIDVDGQRFFYVAIEIRRPQDPGPRVLHIFYPEQSWVEARDQALYPPLLIGVAALFVAFVLSAAIAARVTRPIDKLRSQVEQIAEGDFQPLPISRRNDEIRDLGASVNRMAAMLAAYEDQVRQSERLKTLGQLGGGIAHQMRNAATGCRMALDLHARDCPMAADQEDLQVAQRQLTLMEKHLQRFLRLGQPSNVEFKDVNVAELLERVLPLVRPTAMHIGVSLELSTVEPSLTVRGDADALEQMLINLLINAIEATSSTRGRVAVEARQEGDGVRVEVYDSGPGPDAQLGDEIFTALTTTKPDGVGLGLSVAREIAEQHLGRLSWRRQDDMTCFVVELPRNTVEKPHGATAGH